MTQDEEREVKLSATPELVMPDLDKVVEGGSVRDSGLELLEATYWDSDGLDLVRRGYGLRHRRHRDQPARQGIWTLKTPGRRDGDAFVRGEHEVEAGPESPPDELLGRLPGDIDALRLQPVVVLHTDRHVIDVAGADGRRAVEVVDDSVEVHDSEGKVVDRFRELEVETKGEDVAVREAVIARLRHAGAGPPESNSKYERALRALGHEIGTGDPLGE